MEKRVFLSLQSMTGGSWKIMFWPDSRICKSETTIGILVQIYTQLRSKCSPRSFLSRKRKQIKPPPSCLTHRYHLWIRKASRHDCWKTRDCTEKYVLFHSSQETHRWPLLDMRYWVKMVLWCEVLLSSKNLEQWGCQSHSNLPRIIACTIFHNSNPSYIFYLQWRTNMDVLVWGGLLVSKVSYPHWSGICFADRFVC